MECELLSTIETSKEYKNILLGYPIIVYKEHTNSTFNGLKVSNCVLCWCLFLEEYLLQFDYLLGKKNAIVDVVSRIDIDDLKIQKAEILALLYESDFSNIKFPMHTVLTL
jgi:hypothetical protein